MFDEKGITEKDLLDIDLTRMPCLSKEMYRSWMEDELNNNPRIKEYKLTHTSGSTGIPATNIFTIEESLYG